MVSTEYTRDQRSSSVDEMSRCTERGHSWYDGFRNASKHCRIEYSARKGSFPGDCQAANGSLPPYHFNLRKTQFIANAFAMGVKDCTMS
jgi:hypothetical protein